MAKNKPGTAFSPSSVLQRDAGSLLVSRCLVLAVAVCWCWAAPSHVLLVQHLDLNFFDMK